MSQDCDTKELAAQPLTGNVKYFHIKYECEMISFQAKSIYKLSAKEVGPHNCGYINASHYHSDWLGCRNEVKKVEKKSRKIAISF